MLLTGPAFEPVPPLLGLLHRRILGPHAYLETEAETRPADQGLRQPSAQRQCLHPAGWSSQLHDSLSVRTVAPLLRILPRFDACGAEPNNSVQTRSAHGVPYINMLQQLKIATNSACWQPLQATASNRSALVRPNQGLCEHNAASLARSAACNGVLRRKLICGYHQNA